MARNPNPVSRRTERLTKLAASQRRLADRFGLTNVQAADMTRPGVHLGFEVDVRDLSPLCGAVEGREIETIDEPSHCADCAFVVRAMDLEHLIRDEQGWTGLYLPRNHRPTW